MLMIAVWALACTGSTTTPKPTGTPTGTVPTAETGTTNTVVVPTADTAWSISCDKKGGAPGDLYNIGYELGAEHESVVFTWWCQPTDGPVTVEYSFEKGEWHQAPVVQGAAGANRRVVVGIPYGYTASWRLRLGDDTVVDVVEPIVVPSAPSGLPVPAATTPVGAVPWSDDDRYLLTSVSEDGGSWGSSGPYHTVIYDRQGRPVWTDYGPRGKRTLYAQVSVATGRTLLFDRFTGPSGGKDAIAVRTFLDREVERISIPDHHHAFIELPDGTIAWGANAPSTERLMERAPGAAVATVVWDCRKDWPEGGFCSSNSLYYDAPSGTYYYSFYSVETVTAIDRATGTTLWWAGRAGTFGKTTSKLAYDFNPPESQYWWQHGVFLTDAGTLMVSTHDKSLNEDTNLGREYEIDHDNGELRLIFEYDGGVLAPYNGDIRRLANGHTLHSFGTGAVVKEFDAKGQEVWALDFNHDGTTKRLVGRSEYISDLYRLTSTWEDPSEGKTGSR